MWSAFDVGAVLESLPFGDAVVAAGAQGTTRKISRARLAATPDDLRQLGANGLIVTSARTLVAAGDAEHLLALSTPNASLPSPYDWTPPSRSRPRCSLPPIGCRCR
jgi:hypothetical protein